jgi:light-regulated signal transduction histidine kinase (bacteriophytochrome)
LAFDNITSAKRWRYETFELLTIFAEIIAISFERKKSDLELLASREKFHNEYDRANFYKELFIHDVNNIFNNIQASINLFSKEEDLKKVINIKFLIKTIKQKCFEADKLISIIRKLTQIEESQIPLKHIDIAKLTNQAIEIVRANHKDKKIIVDVEAPREDSFVLANDFLIDVLENILLSSVKYTEKIIINIKIVITKILVANKSFIKIIFIDNQALISDISKERILMRQNKRDEKLRGLLLGFVLIERILDSFKGSLKVEDNNFTLLIPTLP